MSVTSRDGFRFNQGEWRVSHRRLKARNVGSSDWDQFETRTVSQLLMGGTVSIDETDFPDWGFKGMSLRLYDPAQDRWTIFWINSTDGAMQPPVSGRFVDGKGVFEGDDFDGGQPIRVRFEWAGTETPGPQWSQAFSYDGGENWETNWVMQFRRPQ